MRKPAKVIMSAATSVAVLLVGLSLTPINAYADAAMAAEGKKLSFNRKLGNCLACHKIKGGSLPGNIGPELVNMKTRYPDKAKLRAQIWDATVNNPNTIMPPFGKHKMLNEKQIDKVVEYIYTL